MQERLDWIDAVKGTCLLLVMIAHLWHPCPHWVQVLTGGYMQVFFVMAGLTSFASTRSFKEQIIRKSKRLLVPYAIYGIVLLLFGALLPTHANIGHGALGLLYGRYTLFPPTTETNVPLLQACGYLAPFWFLPCIFLSYILLSWYDHSRYPYLVIILAILVSILTPLCPILLPWCMEMAFVGFLLMLCGRAMRPILLKVPTRLSRAFFLQFLLWLGCAVVYMLVWRIDGPINMSLSQMENMSVLYPFRFLFFCVLGICEAIFVSICFRTISSNIVTRSFSYIGRQALRLMCIHLFVGQGVFFILSKTQCPMAVTFTCSIGVIFFVNWLLDYSLQRIARKQASSNISAEEH